MRLSYLQEHLRHMRSLSRARLSKQSDLPGQSVQFQLAKQSAQAVRPVVSCLPPGSAGIAAGAPGLRRCLHAILPVPAACSPQDPPMPQD